MVGDSQNMDHAQGHKNAQRSADLELPTTQNDFELSVPMSSANDMWRSGLSKALIFALRDRATVTAHAVRISLRTFFGATISQSPDFEGRTKRIAETELQTCP